MTTSTSPTHVIIRRNIWQSIWRVVTGETLLAVTVLAAAVLLGLAAILPQTPHTDAQAYSRWLSSVQIRFGGAASLMAALGLFDVVESFVFRAVAGMLGLILLIRLIDRARAARDAARLSPPSSSATNSLEVGSSVRQVIGRLKPYRIRRADGFALADRYPWAYLASIAAHAGPLIILAGLVVSPMTDWRVDRLSLDLGSTATIPNTPYALEYAAN